MSSRSRADHHFGTMAVEALHAIAARPRSSRRFAPSTGASRL